MVPPGEVTAARSAAAESFVSVSSLAEPSSVCAANVSDVARSSPTSTPASISASATRNT